MTSPRTRGDEPATSAPRSPRGTRAPSFGGLAAIALLALYTSCSSTAGGPLPPAPDAGLTTLPTDACAASDLDGDGYGTDPSCPERDCDDTNLSIHPGAPEACNGIDDDCDRAIDEDLGTGFCGRGACRREVPNCQDGRPVACTPGPGSPETCNGIDDDCNGAIDDGVMGASCGVGACARIASCDNGVMGACVAGNPAPETCNRVDDDCNGVVDDGFRATSVNGTYTMLRGFQPACDGAGQRMGPDCNAAINRYCAQAGCTTTGFGPLENSGDVAVIACVAAEPGRDVPYSTLAGIHAGCDGSTQRMGPDCNAAMHRYCTSLGYETGFGPGELGNGTALVTCLRAGAATVVSTGYSVLATHHDGCSGASPDTRYGPACNAAINRFCASQGYVSGFGPVENSGDFAAVACVSP